MKSFSESRERGNREDGEDKGKIFSQIFLVSKPKGGRMGKE